MNNTLKRVFILRNRGLTFCYQKLKSMSRLFLLAVLLFMQQVSAQFSDAVKDSVLAQLGYTSARYNISLDMNTEDYSTTPKDELYTLSKEQLLTRLKGNSRDALVYRALFSKVYYEEKNTEEGYKYLNDAYTNYERWMNEEPANPEPMDQMISLCLNTGNTEIAGRIIDTALVYFPKNLPILNHAIYYHQYIKPDYAKSQQYLDKALALEPTNDRALVFQVTLHQGRFLQALNNKEPMTDFPEIPALNAALKAKPVKPVHEHIDFYRRLSGIYFKGLGQYFESGVEDPYVFNYFKLGKEEEKTIKQAEKWFGEQAGKKGKNQASVLNTLGIIYCIKKDYAKAYDHFRRSYEIKNATSVYESMILALVFLEKYHELANTLHEKIEKEQRPMDYSSLLRVYRKYLKNPEKEKETLQQLQALNTTDPDKNSILSIGYLLNRQKELYQPLIASLGEKSLLNLQLKITAAVMNDDRNTAKEYIQKAETLSPEDEDIKKIKMFTGL